MTRAARGGGERSNAREAKSVTRKPAARSGSVIGFCAGIQSEKRLNPTRTGDQKTRVALEQLERVLPQGNSTRHAVFQYRRQADLIVEFRYLR